MDTVVKYATILSVIITAIIVALNVIAPLTKSNVDNKLLDGLRWFEDLLLKLVLPQHTVTSTPAPSDPTPPTP